MNLEKISRKLQKYAWRGLVSGLSTKVENVFARLSPEIRMTATPDLPWPDDSAKIVSVLFMCRGLGI